MIEGPSQLTSAPRSGPARPITRKSNFLAVYNIGPFVSKFCSLCISHILHSLVIMSKHSHLSAPLLTHPFRCIRIFARLQEAEGASRPSSPSSKSESSVVRSSSTGVGMATATSSPCCKFRSIAARAAWTSPTTPLQVIPTPTLFQPPSPPGNTAPSGASAIPKSASGARRWASPWAVN